MCHQVRLFPLNEFRLDLPLWATSDRLDTTPHLFASQSLDLEGLAAPVPGDADGARGVGFKGLQAVVYTPEAVSEALGLNLDHLPMLSCL